MDKVVSSPEEAVADIKDGASVAIAGFGVGHRFPTSLILALKDQGARGLTLVCNSLGAVSEMKPQVLAENGQVSKLIASFSARAGMRSPTDDLIASGQLQVELVPQGVLVERLRAAAAGLPAFYSPVGVSTSIAADKEVRSFGGRDHVLEHALPVDVALIRGHRADRHGNVEFRGGSQNFNPSFAKAAKVAIVEVDEIVEAGEIPPEDVGLPGIFVSRVVQTTVRLDGAELRAHRPKREDGSRRSYLGKPGLTRDEIAARAAELLPEGAYVNLGVGMPTLVSNHLGDKNVVLHAENGVLGYGAQAAPDAVDPDNFNASGEFVSLLPGAAFFDSVESFEIARSGKLDAVILGGFQVDRQGSLANWSNPTMSGGGIGGAMDLVVEGNNVIVLMIHQDRDGAAKLVEECSFPLTAFGCVSVVITDLGLFRWNEDGVVLEEVAPGFTPEEVLSLTPMQAKVASNVGVVGSRSRVA
jgi:3-oxoacid CoA-transferase